MRAGCGDEDLLARVRYLELQVDGKLLASSNLYRFCLRRKPYVGHSELVRSGRNLRHAERALIVRDNADAERCKLHLRAGNHRIAGIENPTGDRCFGSSGLRLNGC